MENLKKIIKQFPKVGEVKEIKALTSGLINQTYLVKSVSPEEPDYVLQRINHLIFTNIEMLQHNIEVVTRHIRQKLEARHEEDIERKVLHFLPSTNGKTYFYDGEGYWRISIFIPRSQTLETVTPESSHLAGLKFGEFQAMLADVPEQLGEIIPDFHNMEFRLKHWIQENTLMLVSCSFVFFTILMQILHWCKINIFKVVVMLGTFALAMAFAGNDLVNFIGVPLAGFSAYTDFMANGNGEPMGYLMNSLNGPAKTPFLFLFLAGVIMVYALITSKKAQNVVKTSVDLSRQDEGDEMFGSSAVARSIVRSTMSASESIAKILPDNLKRWADSRFNKDVMIMENGAAFDLIRASVNLVLAGLLIALGTSLKLPLSTTYVTFMVAMGSSLADRAWSRDSAVYRITGVLSVIGGWFITAGAAFTICFVVTLIMYYGGTFAMLALIALAIFLLVRSNIHYSKKQKDKGKDDIFSRLIASKDKEERWRLLRQHVNNTLVAEMAFTNETYRQITDGFINENLKALRKAVNNTDNQKEMLKKIRRKEILGLRRIDNFTAIEKNTWFHLGSNSCEQMLYCLKRICDPCKEHVDNKFTPLSERATNEFIPIRDEMTALMTKATEVLANKAYDQTDALLREGALLKGKISTLRKEQMDRIQERDVNVKASMVYLNVLQESQELVSYWRHLLRADRMFQTDLKK